MSAERGGRAGPICGLLTCLLWLPMVYVIGSLPPLDDPARVAQLWSEHGDAMRTTTALIVVGYPPLLVFVSDVQCRVEAAGSRLLSRAVLANMLVFVIALNVALGLAAAAGLVYRADPGSATGYPLHVAAFVLAAPAAGPGTGLFVLLAILTRSGQLRPGWLVWPAVLGVICNAGALGGLFRLDGIWNSGNGFLGGIALPLGSLLTWMACASVAWLSPSRTPVLGPASPQSARELP